MFSTKNYLSCIENFEIPQDITNLWAVDLVNYQGEGRLVLALRAHGAGTQLKRDCGKCWGWGDLEGLLGSESKEMMGGRATRGGLREPAQTKQRAVGTKPLEASAGGWAGSESLW